MSQSEFDGSTLPDEAGGDNTGTHRSGVSTADTCPSEDLDGDGYANWEDCDDTDSTKGASCLPGPIAEYRFDEGSGQVLTDYTGNGNDGVMGSQSTSDSSDPTWNSGYVSLTGTPFQGSGPRPGDCIQLGLDMAALSDVTFQLVVRGPSQSNQIQKMEEPGAGTTANGSQPSLQTTKKVPAQ